MYNGPMPKPDPSDLSRLVKAEARLLGFDLVGVTDPSRPPHIEVFNRWLDQGRHGQMAYLATDRARQRRADLFQILPECLSVVMVGINYLSEGAHQRLTDAQADFHIAAYAWGGDYHETLPPRLEALVDFIEEQVGEPVPHMIYTDSGPVLERELAQRAGLGWIGKNTCLINPNHGSYFLLAEVLLGIELAADTPFEFDRCGHCTRCIEACPTGCILPDRTLDARRCLSYLTIECKEVIPVDLGEKVGKWLFGCDVCQQVCPWNERFSGITDETIFQPGEWVGQARLGDFLHLEPEKWRAGLKNSPLERPRRKGLVRNACVVAGNSGDPSWVPYLVDALRADPEPLVRRQAAWALGQIGGRSAVEALGEALMTEADQAVRQAISTALNP